MEVYDFMLDRMRRDFAAVLERAWSENLAPFSYQDRIKGIRWLVEDQLIPRALATNPHGIEFAIIMPRISRLVMEEFLQSKSA